MPLYHRIFVALRDEIRNGRRLVGSQLPTEHELARHHQVSRVTARRALDELALEGLVVRRRRHGTTVCASGRPSAIEANLDQALDTLIAFGRGTQVRVLRIAQVLADPEIAAALAIEPGEPVIEAVRIRDRDGVALGRVTSHAIASCAPIFTPENLLNRPLLALLADNGHIIGGGHETIAACAADEDTAALLGIEWRAPLLTVQRLVSDHEGRPLLRTLAEYRADLYRIELDLHGGNRSR